MPFADAMACALVALVVLCWGMLPLTAAFESRLEVGHARRSASVLVGALALFAFAMVTWQAERDLVVPPPLAPGLTAFHFQLDRLAAWFLVVIALIGGVLTLYLPGYLEPLQAHADPRPFWIAFPFLLLSMALVVVAANALTFLVAWEAMSLSSLVLVGTSHRSRPVRSAALIYMGATRVGTIFLAGGFLWAHALAGSWEFNAWHFEGKLALGPGVLLLIGLGAKAGMWPFHLWLPIAHPAAPAPVSALMSGVMVKVAVYAMIRWFVLAPAFRHPWFGYGLLGLGAISAFWGVMFALLQHDLKRLLAYHTVENLGLILIGVGGAIVLTEHNLGLLARIALAAALFHTLNHAVFKSLLFLGAGAVDQATGTRDLERLGGLGQRMNVSFACFLVGSASICALPPLNGFASEWLLYQTALLAAARLSAPLPRFGALLLIGWIALVGALALACFVKACGVAFLGRPRSAAAAQGNEVEHRMRMAQMVLAGLCVLLGLTAPLVLSVLDSVVSPLESGGPSLRTVWTLPTGAVALVLLATVGAVFHGLRIAARQLPVQSYITWECGFGDLSARMQVTATSFAQPLARMFASLYRYAVTLQIEGLNRRLFPEEITVESSTEAVLESRVYAPLLRRLGRAADLVVRLQAGSIHFYLLTMFLTLVLLLAWEGYSR